MKLWHMGISVRKGNVSTCLKFFRKFDTKFWFNARSLENYMSKYKLLLVLVWKYCIKILVRKDAHAKSIGVGVSIGISVGVSIGISVGKSIRNMTFILCVVVWIGQLYWVLINGI